MVNVAERSVLQRTSKFRLGSLTCDVAVRVVVNVRVGGVVGVLVKVAAGVGVTGVLVAVAVNVGVAAAPQLSTVALATPVPGWPGR